MENFEGVIQDPDQIVVVSNPGSPQSPETVSRPGDVVSALKDLAQLHASGALSDAEFAESKISPPRRRSATLERLAPTGWCRRPCC
jgi:hypothetical protein